MTTRKKILLGIAGVYIVGMAIVILIFGAPRRDNEEFAPQNEFKTDTWIALPGPFDFNKGVMYLLIAGILTVMTMLYIANRMQAKPNRTQTAVETLFGLMLANILAGHLIILFMSGGLAVLLGLEVLGVFTLPFGIALYLFEVGLVATLQAFIFATLSAIYLGGAVAESH